MMDLWLPFAPLLWDDEIDGACPRFRLGLGVKVKVRLRLRLGLMCVESGWVRFSVDLTLAPLLWDDEIDDVCATLR